MLLEKLISTAVNAVKKAAETTKKFIKTAATYVKTVVLKKTIDDARTFGEYSNQYLSLDSEKQGIIRDAINKLQQIDLSTEGGRAEASRIFSDACSLLKGRTGEKSANIVQTSEPTPAPTPYPTPAPTSASQQSLSQTTYPDGYSFMVSGSNLSQQLLQHLILKYDQSAKEYNGLTGANTFKLIEKESNVIGQFISDVYNNSLRPIGQMVTEDWQSFWASGAARYNAYRNEGGTYNTLNYWTSGIMDAAAAIYRANGYRAQAAWNDPNLYNIANYLTLGLAGQFDKTVNTPISDSDYWRAMRNILSTEAGAIAVYNAFASGIALPTTTEGLIEWGNRMGAPSGVLPQGTFDKAFAEVDGLSKIAKWEFRPSDELYLNPNSHKST